jgi:hypothetical protein
VNSISGILKNRIIQTENEKSIKISSATCLLQLTPLATFIYEAIGLCGE